MLICPHCEAKLDPAAIPDHVLMHERGRRNAGRRKTHKGGPGRPVCVCGTCKACRRRAGLKGKAT